jgi:hypothetical protein
MPPLSSVQLVHSEGSTRIKADRPLYIEGIWGIMGGQHGVQIGAQKRVHVRSSAAVLAPSGNTVARLVRVPRRVEVEKIDAPDPGIRSACQAAS